MTPDRLEQIRARAERFAAKMADDRRPALEIPAAMSAADVPDLLAEVERLTAALARVGICGDLTEQLRQAKEERAAVALERDELINDRELAVLARDQWAMDVVVYHDIPAEPGDDLYASIAKYIKARKAEAESLREQLVHFANGMQERNRRAERVAEAAKTARDLFGPQPYFGGFRELAAAVDEWQRTQEESRG